MSQTTGSNVHQSIKSQVEAYLSDTKSKALTAQNIEVELRKHELEQSRQVGVIVTAHLRDVVSGHVQGATPEIQRLNKEREAGQAKAQNDHQTALRSLTNLRDAESTALELLERTQAFLSESLSSNHQLNDARVALGTAEARLSIDQRAYETVRTECRIKVEPYYLSRSFQHLMAREYGTTQYRGTLFFAWGDRWLAKQMDYLESKRNYDALLRLPERTSQAAQASLKVRDAAQVVVSSIVEAIERESGVKAATTSYRDSREAKNKREGAVANLLSKIGQYSSLLDDQYVAMRNLAKQEVLGMKEGQLRALVLVSGGQDLAASNLTDSIRTCDFLRADLRVASANFEASNSRYLKAKDMLRHFERQGYNGKRRIYDSSFDVNAMVTGFVAGNISVSGLDTAVRSRSLNVPEDGVYSASASSKSSTPSSSDSVPRRSSSEYSNSNTFGGSGNAGGSGGYSNRDSF